MHGAEFYANKKHKGIEGGSEDGPGGLDSSPRSEDMQSHKTASLSSPSIKSEVCMLGITNRYLSTMFATNGTYSISLPKHQKGII